MSDPPFSRTFHVRWGDMDFNAHMRNTAYLDISADVRMMFFEEKGFSMREFERLKIGPVITRDELEYFRELRLLQQIAVTLALVGLSAKKDRFRLRNEFFTPEKKLAARVTSTGGWLDHSARRITPPPEEIANALHGLSKADDYAELTSGS